MKYVLLFCGSQELQRQWEQETEARDAQYAAVGRWFEEHGAKMGPGHQLQPPHTATTVRFEGASKGEPIVRDGPYIEGNEVIGGYVEINVADLDEALSLAKSWPGGGAVEIRPVVEQM
jgi:hypothetical protein